MTNNTRKCLVCDLVGDHNTEDCPFGDGIDADVWTAADEAEYYGETPEEVAWGRPETDSCERGTPGCSVLHTRDSECQTW